MSKLNISSTFENITGEKIKTKLKKNKILIQIIYYLKKLIFFYSQTINS